MCATWALCVLFCITYRPVPQYCWHPGRGLRPANVPEVPKQYDNNKTNKKLDPATRQPYVALFWNLEHISGPEAPTGMSAILWNRPVCNANAKQHTQGPCSAYAQTYT